MPFRYFISLKYLQKKLNKAEILITVMSAVKAAPAIRKKNCPTSVLTVLVKKLQLFQLIGRF